MPSRFGTNQQVHAADPWLIAEADYPRQGTAAEQLEFLVGYAVLAPSRYNAQPWSFIRRSSELELCLDQTRLLPVADSRRREAIMNCGTALYYLRTAARYFGHEPVVESFPEASDETLLARIRLGAVTPATDGVCSLFHAIRHRRTWERSFRHDPIPPELSDALRAQAFQEGATLNFLTEEQRRTLADMVKEGENVLQQNPDYRLEAQTWQGEGQKKGWITSMVSDLVGALALHTSDPGLVLEAPGLAILGTENDTPQDWLAAGQALGAVLLLADTSWVEASFLNQPVEVLSLRARLQQLVGGVVPQLILRLGRMQGAYLPHKPRRSPAEVQTVEFSQEQPQSASDGQMPPLFAG